MLQVVDDHDLDVVHVDYDVVGAIELVRDEDVYPDTDNPVWILGYQLSAKYDLTELKELVLTRPWMSYR